MVKRKVALSLGSNLADRLSYIKSTSSLIENAIKENLFLKSKIYETTPIDCPKGSGFFLNAALFFETDWSIYSLLKFIQGIERDKGRLRYCLNAPRTIDIDIIFYGQELINEAEICVPHPRMTQRAFVLVPLADICPDFIHPIKKKSVRQLLLDLKDGTSIKVFKKKF